MKRLITMHIGPCNLDSSNPTYYEPHYEKQVSQGTTIAHLRAIINLLGLFRCSRAANSSQWSDLAEI